MPLTTRSGTYVNDSEDRFRTIFGARRTPSSRPTTPLSADYERSSYANLCLFSEKGADLWRLYCQKPPSPLTPLLWLVSYLPSHELTFCSSWQDWHDDARGQLALLSTLLGDRGTFATRRGSSRLGISKTSGFALGLSARGDYAHLISPQGKERGFWSEKDLTSDPDGIWDAIIHTLLTGRTRRRR